MSTCTERPKLVVNRGSDFKKPPRSFLLHLPPFASPMAYRLALAQGMLSLNHAQSTPSVLPAIIFSWTRPEINYYILGSIPLSIFLTIFKREPQVVVMKAPLAYRAITLGVLGSIISISQVSTMKYRFSDDSEIRHLISAKFAAWLKLIEN